MFKRLWVQSQSWILDGHFFTCICWKNCNNCLKRQKNETEAGDSPFIKGIKMVYGGGQVIEYFDPETSITGQA